MADQAVRWTDKQIEELERRIRDVYTDAAADIQRKLDKFIAKFRRDDKKYRAQLEAGEITRLAGGASVSRQALAADACQHDGDADA